MADKYGFTYYALRLGEIIRKHEGMTGGKEYKKYSNLVNQKLKERQSEILAQEAHLDFFYNVSILSSRTSLKTSWYSITFSECSITTVIIQLIRDNNF